MNLVVTRIATSSAILIILLAAVASRASARSERSPRQAFVPVLIYHHVKWLKASDDAIERGLTIQPDQFSAQLNYLQAAGYHSVTAAQLASFLRGGAALPSKPVVLTFDDGYSDMFPHVYPALLRRHMRATFFIVPGLLDAPRYLKWGQVQSMSARGMDIEAHSMTHPDLQLVNGAQLTHEVSGSRQTLERKLHRVVRVFCYPYGAFDARIESAVSRAGFFAAFTTQQGWWQKTAGLLALPRVYVDIDDTLSIFKGRLTANGAMFSLDPT